MKRIVLVHGWDGGPDRDWFPWLRKELENYGYTVIAPQLPEAEVPRKELWIPALASAVGTPDAETYFVAHSMGNQATLRYLESLPEGVVIGGAVFVAGFVNSLVNLEGPENEEIATAWTGTPLNLSKVRTHLLKSIAIFSDDDEWVTLDNADIFRERIGSEIVTEKAQGHFNEDTAPVILETILKLAQN